MRARVPDHEDPRMPSTVVTSLFGYVATRKSFACRKPPNGIAFVSVETVCSGPKTAEPGASPCACG